MSTTSEPLRQKKRIGRPPGPVTRERAMKAISILQRSDLTPEEIAQHLLPQTPLRAPEILWTELQRTGAVPVGMTLQDLVAPRPGAPPSRTLVELAPLEDGINPIEMLIYLPDAVRTCTRELAGIKKELRTIAQALQEGDRGK